jgi:hypothetical protein
MRRELCNEKSVGFIMIKWVSNLKIIYGEMFINDFLILKRRC